MTIEVTFSELSLDNNDVLIGTNHSLLFNMLPVLVFGLNTQCLSLMPAEAAKLDNRKQAGSMIRAAMFLDAIVKSVAKADREVIMQFRTCGLEVLGCIGEFKLWLHQYYKSLSADSKEYVMLLRKTLPSFEIDEGLLVTLLESS